MCNTRRRRRRGLIILALIILVLAATTAQSQNTLNYMQQGGSRWVIRGTFDVTAVNAAGGSANPIDYTGTLGIMNSNDTFQLFDINLTNANHTGSTNVVEVMNIASITGDANATETAISIGTGWDYALDLGADIILQNDETISNSTNGTIGFVGALNLCAADGTPAASAGILAGAGTSGTPYVMPTASNKGMSFYLSSASTNTAHALEGLYVNVDFGNGTGATAAPHGEAGRFRASLKGSPTGVCGSHNTVEWISAGSSCSGATYGTYSNLVFLNSTAGGGRLSGLCAELFSGGSNTDLTGASASVMCLSIQGTVTANKFTVPLIDIEIPTDLVGAGLIVDDTASAVTIDGKIRVRINGVDKWLLYDDDHD